MVVSGGVCFAGSLGSAEGRGVLPLRGEGILGMRGWGILGARGEGILGLRGEGILSPRDLVGVVGDPCAGHVRPPGGQEPAASIALNGNGS